MKHLLLSLLCVVWITPVLAQLTPDSPVPVDTGVVIKTLPNGLTYYIRANAKPEKRAELRLVVNAGSILEDEDQRGLAHFLEHMAFNGTTHFEKQELVDFLMSIGMRFGADVNAYTSFDETVYSLHVPTDDAAIMDKSFLILKDWAHGISFDPEEVDKERPVVVEEWRLGKSAASRIRDKQFPLLFKDSIYAERLPIGSKEVVETAPISRIRDFYKDWYRPDLMAVVAVGDFDAAEVEKLIVKHMGSIPAVENPRERPLPQVPGHKETLVSIETDPELTRSDIDIMYKHNASATKTMKDWRQSIVRGMYRGMLNQRLGERTREANPPYLFAYNSMSNMVRSKAFFNQAAAVKEGAFEEGLTALLEESARAKKHGFTQSELDRMKVEMLRSMEQSYNERDKTESVNYASQYVYHYLESSPIPGIENAKKFYDMVLPGITLEEVNRAADRWITDDNRVILVSAPEKEGLELPKREDLLKLIDEVSKRDVKPYEDKVSDAPLVAAEPKGGSVTKEKHIEELGVTVWTLSNGVRVVLKPTELKNDEVTMTAFSPGGSSLVDDKDYMPAITATGVVGLSGLATFDSIELQKKLAGKVAGVYPTISELQEGLRGFASPKDLQTLFELTYLHFTAPRATDQALQSIKTRWQASLKNRLADPGAVFSDKMRAHMYNNHPRRQPLTEASLDKLDAKKSLEIYRERFADASDFTFIFVGNIDLKSMKPMVAKWLGGLPSTNRKENWRDIGVNYATGSDRLEVRKGLEPKSSVQMVFHGDAAWNLKDRYALSSLAQVLRIRLREVLREDMGGVYGVSVQGSLIKRPQEMYSSVVAFGCDPANVDDLISAVKKEIKNIQDNGVEKSYMDNVKEMQLRSFEEGSQQNGFWSANLRFYFDYDVDPLRILGYKERVEALTSERLQEAARKYFDDERLLIGVLFPEDQVKTN